MTWVMSFFVGADIVAANIHHCPNEINHELPKEIFEYEHRCLGFPTGYSRRIRTRATFHRAPLSSYAILEDMVNRSSKKPGIREAGFKDPAAVALGRLGGLKGGKARAAKLTAQKRREIAQLGAERRWSKLKKKSERDIGSTAPSQESFEIQRQAFQGIPASALVAYEGQFVVSQNGRIIDSDYDLPTLTRRLFRQIQRKSVYITKVGGIAAIIGSPSVEP